MDIFLDTFVYILLLLQIPTNNQDLLDRATSIAIRNDLLASNQQIKADCTFKHIGRYMYYNAINKFPPSSDIHNWPDEEIIDNIRSNIFTLNDRYKELRYWHLEKLHIYNEIIYRNDELSDFWFSIIRAKITYREGDLAAARCSLWWGKLAIGDKMYYSGHVPFQFDNFYRKH